MTDALVEQVRVLAGDACEYCQFPQSASPLRFVLDHVVPLGRGGVRALENAALSCGWCSRHKGSTDSGIDPGSGAVTRLFHPRRDAWAEHFRRNGATLVGITPIGRATIAVLAINDPSRITVRDCLRREGV